CWASQCRRRSWSRRLAAITCCIPRPSGRPRGAAAAGAVYVMATSGTTTVEEAAAERVVAPQWFQLYMEPKRSETGALLDRIDAGAKAIIVSNHGGRHLDTTVTTADAIGEIAEAVAGKSEVYVDGGIRRGTDILKALALGARAVLIGRPVLWGLAVDGAQGVQEVLEHLHSELTRAMQLSGAASLAEVTRDLVPP